MDELESADSKRKTRRRLIIISVSLVLLIVLIISVVAGTVTLIKKKNSSSSDDKAPASNVEAIKSICSVTQYPSSCVTSLESSNSKDPVSLFDYSLTVALNSQKNLSNLPDEYMTRTDDLLVKYELQVCRTVLNDAVELLNDSISLIRTGGRKEKLTALFGPVVDDLKTWLSAVLTNQETCLDALLEANATFIDDVKLMMKNSTEYVSNSLAIVSKFPGLVQDLKVSVHRQRRLAAKERLHFPPWLEGKDRRMLQESTNPNPDVTVAADGTGDVRTITEAVTRIPKKSYTRFVIHIKAGKYVENIVLEKAYWNVMVYGDGKDSTFVSGHKNFVDGTPTFSTATFAVAGMGFIARDITFINNAGAEKHQAVAFRSGSDYSVFHRCSFDSFQDTLYAHSNRQFYRECDITGTIDFIFGNAAVVFQNCNILPRNPLRNQFVTITAQGKTDPNQNTGISIQRCTISTLDRLTAPTYLGRPWKEFSTTVIMETSIGAFLNPKGWISWVQNVDPPSTISYAEYQNTGPGASTGNRVTWAGYKPTLTAAEASKYTVGTFLQGVSWLPATNVAYDST